jgi:hypothetical protein
MNCIYIFLIIIMIFVIFSLFSLDHFKPINSLNIKYNSEKVRVPNQLVKPSKKKLSLKDKINAELQNQPLTFQNQIYSMDKYPYVGAKTACMSNDHCNITAECNKDTDLFKRDSGVGVCTVRVPNKTVFDINY